jgi:uncharacterized protein YhdP
MSFCRRRFNLYLLAVALVTLPGCALWHHEQGPVAVVRVHVESESSEAGSTKSISVLRARPVMVNIQTDPILTEADVEAAKLLDSPEGGFAVELKFEETAGWRLEQYSATNPGKHLAIFGQWSDKPADGRWLAAPLIVRRIANSTLTFTPDASREEMEQWVKGLNERAKKNAGLKDSQ